ncbi:hypothetical protein EDM54_17345 [Brevibacillus borstelensis]|nr:hypothetical protein EDM54_17345 [Brevibacillus borstelensis]
MRKIACAAGSSLQELSRLFVALSFHICRQIILFAAKLFINFLDWLTISFAKKLVLLKFAMLLDKEMISAKKEQFHLGRSVHFVLNKNARTTQKAAGQHLHHAVSPQTKG